jgi:hypothetical protein
LKLLLFFKLKFVFKLKLLLLFFKLKFVHPFQQRRRPSVMVGVTVAHPDALQRIQN